MLHCGERAKREHTKLLDAICKQNNILLAYSIQKLKKDCQEATGYLLGYHWSITACEERTGHDPHEDALLSLDS